MADYCEVCGSPLTTNRVCPRAMQHGEFEQWKRDIEALSPQEIVGLLIESGAMRDEVARLARELDDTRRVIEMWQREVSGRDADIDRLTRERDEAIRLMSEMSRRAGRAEGENEALAKRNAAVAPITHVVLVKLRRELDEAREQTMPCKKGKKR